MSSFFFTGAGSLLNRLSSSRSELADLFEVVFSVELPQGSEDVVEDADEVAGAEVGGAEKSSNRDSILLICFMPCTRDKEYVNIREMMKHQFLLCHTKIF